MTASVFPPEIGGPGSYVPVLAAGLARRGHDVHVICLGRAQNHDDGQYPFRVTRVPRGSSRILRIADTVRAIAAHVRTADVLYANGLSLEARFAGGLLRRPIVHKVVGDLAWEGARHRGWFQGTLEAYQVAPKRPALLLLNAWRRASLRGAAAVITPSAYFAAIVAGWGVPRSRIHVIHNALPIEPPAPVAIALPAFDGATLMTICRLVEYKKVDGLIDAVAALDRVRLVVVGDGPSRSKLEAHALARGVAHRVLWMGTRSPGEIQALLSVADGFLLNSSVENLPHVLLEAMRAGVPVVATAVGGVPEVVLDGVTGQLVQPGDTDALVRALIWLINSPSERLIMAEAARARVRTRFHEDGMVGQTLAVLATAARRDEREDAAT